MPGVKGRSGRPPESKMKRFRELIDNCWPVEEREKVMLELVRDCTSKVFQERQESRKLLFAYTFGKPTEHVRHEILDPKKVAEETRDELRTEFPRLSDEQLDSIIHGTFGDMESAQVH
jgi:hypothetical protein